MKGVGRVYQRDLHHRHLFEGRVRQALRIARRRSRPPILVNDRVEMRLLRGAGGQTLPRSNRSGHWNIAGNPEHHEYELYLAIEDIDAFPDQNQEPTNGMESITEALSQDGSRRVLPHLVPEKDLWLNRGACRSISTTGSVATIPGTGASGQMVLRKEPRCRAPSLTPSPWRRKSS